MRKLRQVSRAVVLALTLNASAFAGIMSTGKADDAPPDPAPATATNSALATTPSDQQNSDAPNSPAVDLALDLLQSLLSAF
jgi:hypothetical protein